MARAATKGRLRVLGYHDVPDPAPFRRQIEEIADRYTPVSGVQVAAALARDQRLPERAVWITFDDGHPNVVENALPVLKAFGIKATLFVCPGLIDTTTPFWWQVAERAWSLGLCAGTPNLKGLLTLLKRLPDPERRLEIRRLEELIEDATGTRHIVNQATAAQLKDFQGAGGELGNHTWDHPLLDQCTIEEQRRQIFQAEEWLRASGLGGTRYFAYPNGNATAFAADMLGRMGFSIATLFDHRLARVDRDPLHLSRLRVNSDQPLPRFRAILGGIHPAIQSMRTAGRAASSWL
jgi:peptidoglycan/xylan/chitin deacetylase (PgdA/CDA1 family)